MAKRLNDTQLTILSTAAARDDHRILPLPKLKAPPVAVQKTLQALLDDGFIAEIAASRDDAAWEQSAEQGRTTLIITPAGLAAIGIDAEPAITAPATTRTKPRKGLTRGKAARGGTRTPKPPHRPRVAAAGGKQSKQSIVIALLRRGQGASIPEMMAATDWQAHSVRGFMSGALKKRLKLDVVSDKAKTGERRYYIAALTSK